MPVLRWRVPSYIFPLTVSKLNEIEKRTDTIYKETDWKYVYRPCYALFFKWKWKL